MFYDYTANRHLFEEKRTPRVTDNPLPWQKSLDKLTPGRVAQAIGRVFAVIGTPAQPPKPRGKSPGWKTDQPHKRRIRYPIVKKLQLDPVKSNQNFLSTVNFRP